MALPRIVETGRVRAAYRSRMRASRSWFTTLLWVHGIYYLVTGIWPLVSIGTFQMVTGPKTDLWLVMTVGVLITAVAITLLVAAWRRQNPIEVAVLALASAIGLTGIDILYVARQVIAPIYLADAAAEVILIGAWAVTLVRARGSKESFRHGTR